MAYRKSIILIVLSAIIISVLFFYTIIGDRQQRDEKPENNHKDKGDSLDKKSDDKTEENKHPYGNPVKGPLQWEFNERLQSLQAEYSADIRMGAFQAILPDPLPGEKENIALAADKLCGTIVEPGSIFSLNRKIGPYTERYGYRPGPTYKGSKLITTIGGGVCKIASVLYNVTILADLKVVERWSHGMQVPYVPAGQDATIYTGVKDFRFLNNTENPVIIWSDTVGDTLYIALYGSEIPPVVEWHHQVLNRWDYKTVYHTNYKLGKGEEKVVVPGADGLAVKSWLTIKDREGNIRKKDLGIDYYKPMNRLVERGRL